MTVCLTAFIVSSVLFTSCKGVKTNPVSQSAADTAENIYEMQETTAADTDSATVPSDTEPDTEAAPKSGQPTEKETDEAALHTEKAKKIYDSVDEDLSSLNAMMTYTQLFNMAAAPQDYIGKTVRITGTFTSYEDPQTGTRYFACYVTDITMCCTQGLNLMLAGSNSFPDDYPPEGAEITVAGVFGTFRINGIDYCCLEEATIEKAS